MDEAGGKEDSGQPVALTGSEMPGCAKSDGNRKKPCCAIPNASNSGLRHAGDRDVKGKLSKTMFSANKRAPEHDTPCERSVGLGRIVFGANSMGANQTNLGNIGDNFKRAEDCKDRAKPAQMRSNANSGASKCQRPATKHAILAHPEPWNARGVPRME